MLAGAFACMLGGVHAAEPAFSDDPVTKMKNWLHDDLVRFFTLDKEFALDPALRAAAEKIAEEHVARVDKLLPAWIEEERLHQSGAGKPPSSGSVHYAVYARILNELALWQLEPGDAHYENATLTALRTGPGACEVPGDTRFLDFASRIMRIQILPAAEREAMLASERTLLSHWGQPRANPAPWPDPLPQQAAYALLQRGPADADHPRLALPPVLAYRVLGKGVDYAGLQFWERCTLQQWWLNESLRQGVAPAAALNAFRYGTMLTVVDRIGNAWDKPGAADVKDPAGPPPFPVIAGRYGATGVTTVNVRLDAAGNPLDAAVTGRKVEVPGIRGVRPVAFENVFDAATVKYAMDKGRHYDKPSGKEPYKFQMNWSLDDDKNANVPKGAKP
ncbi:MAG: hypothetical protein JF619_03210 [Massilia sp.]|nr:hypothetical protein [Massilia sp.]